MGTQHQGHVLGHTPTSTWPSESAQTALSHPKCHQTQDNCQRPLSAHTATRTSGRPGLNSGLSHPKPRSSHCTATSDTEPRLTGSTCAGQRLPLPLPCTHTWGSRATCPLQTTGHRGEPQPRTARHDDPTHPLTPSHRACVDSSSCPGAQGEGHSRKGTPAQAPPTSLPGGAALLGAVPQARRERGRLHGPAAAWRRARCLRALAPAVRLTLA